MRQLKTAPKNDPDEKTQTKTRQPQFVGENSSAKAAAMKLAMRSLQRLVLLLLQSQQDVHVGLAGKC
jgi:hypothetical protein